MWVVKFGRHYLYLKHHEFHIETPYRLKALAIYWYFHCWYVLSVFPVKYVKMYKIDSNLIRMKSYQNSYQGRKNGFGKSISRKNR